jgi:hypothetical protein
MMSAITMLPSALSVTESEGPKFRVSERREVEALQTLAGAFYSAAAPGDGKDVAARLKMGQTSWWRRTSGVEPTPLSRAGEEVLRFQRAGYETGFYIAYLEVSARLPALERLTALQIHDQLVRTHALEDASNAALNQYQSAHLTRGDRCFFDMARAAIHQQDVSANLARLALRLHLLTGG